MNGNFRNSYNGGWGQFNYNYYPTNQMPAYYPNMRPLPHQVPAHYYGMRHPTYQMPAYYPNMRPLPHQVPSHYYGMRQPTYHYAEKRPLPQKTPKASADKKISPDKKPEDFADKRNLPHQKPEDYTDKHCLPQQAPEHVADKRDLPQQKPECYADKRPLPDQTPESFAEKRILPHQNSDGFADKRNLPLQKPEDSTDNKCLPQQTPDLPQQTPEGYADKNGLPHETSKPTIPAVAPVKCQKAAIVSCEICGVSFPQNSLKDHYNGKKHRKNLSKLCKQSTNLSKQCKQSTKCKTSKKLRMLLNRTLKRIEQSKSISMDLHVLGGSNTSALTKDTCSGSDPIAIAPPQGLMTSQINSQTKVEGKEHLEVQNGGVNDCAAKKCLPHQMPKPAIPADKKSSTRCEICHCTIPTNDIEQHNNGRKHQNKVKSMECEISKGEVSGHIQNSQMNPVVQLKKVPKSKKDGLPVENTSQFRCKEVPAEGSKSKLGDHTVAKDHSLKVNKVENEAPSFKNKKVPAEKCKRKVSDTTDAKDHGSKCEIGETSGAKYMKMNSGIRKPVKSSKSEVKSLVQIPEVTPPSGRVASPKMAPIPEEKNDQPHVSASLSQKSKDKEHHKFQNTTVKKNDQPQSTPVELNPSEGSNRIESMSCDFAAIAPSQGPMTSQINSQTKVEGKEHLEVQNEGVKDCADKKSTTRCEICDCMVSKNYIELHNNGRKHQNKVKSMECKISKGEVSGHIRNSQMNPIVHLKKVPKSKKDGHLVENTSQFRCKEVPAEGSKSKLGDHTVAKDHSLMVKKVQNEAPSFKNNKVPAERSKRKVSDTTDAKDHGSKCEIGETSGAKYMKMNSEIRKPVKSSKSEVKSLVQIPEVTPPSGRVTSPKMAPIPEEKNDQPHVSASLSQESKGKENHKFQNATVEKNDQPQSTPVELNPSEGSNRTESMSCDFSAISPPLVPVNFPVFTPSPAVESSLEPSIQTDSRIEVEEGKEHIDVQNCGVKTNDQPQSSTMELHANGGSDINTLIKEDKCSDSGAIVIIPSQSPIASQVATPESQRVIHTEKSEGKVHNEIQNHTVDSNDQQRSISMELDDPAGCMTNTQTEVVNSDSAAIEIVIEPLASAPPDAVWSGFEPLTDTEIEPQLSEAVVYYESDDPIEGADIEMPLSVPIEIDAGSEVSSETETVDGSPQAEVEMDVLADELGIIQLPQVSVCLTCGDEGFEEAIVYCYKCKGYAIHRYCLDGPVIFTDKVIWFCADCEEEVIDTDYPDQVTSDSEKGEVGCSDGCVTVVYPQPIADPIWRGSLQVFHKSDDKIARLMAHLSTLACPKVLEETRHLPNVLYGNLLQRSAVWPASFKKFGTNNLSIGLYFFPQNESVERYYDQLVHEMITNDLAISAKVEKSELLIFASTMLPSQYKRFQSKYYLWGIFIRKQTPSKIK